MRIKLKKVTVASLNASLVQTLVFLSFIPRSTTMQKQLHKNQDWYLLKFSEDLHECFVPTSSICHRPVERHWYLYY